MHILLLSPWFPSPPFGGALIRVYETLRHLSRRHRVTLLAPVNEAPEPRHLSALTDLCETVVTVPVSERVQAVLRRLALGLLRGMPFIQSLHRDAGLARQMRRLTSLAQYDIIHVEHSFMAPYLADVRGQANAKTVLSMHNVESQRFRRELKTARGARRLALLTDSVLFDSWEEKAIRQFDGIVTVSTLEEEWVRERAPHTPVASVPNGVDTDYFSPAPPIVDPQTIVFAGLMNYPPNIDAAVWFCDAILPLVTKRHPGVRFRIVGDKPTAEVLALAQRTGVDVTGRVPDVRPYVADCAAVVVPLRFGAGTRLKILEAMAMQRPVVSTHQGAEGLAVADGVNILLGDTPDALANQLCLLVESVETRARLASAGRQLVERTYDWSSCFVDLDSLYRRITASGDFVELNPSRQAAS